MQAEQFVREGRLDEALDALQQAVRSNPAGVKERVFLFQLLSVLGQYDRAMTQLNVAAEMDPSTLLMAQVCRPALNCEVLRREIFQGKRTPLVFGEARDWVGWMVQANQLASQGEYGAAAELRSKALEEAPAVEGVINDEPFEWIADADSRLGPILELIFEGRYYWVPFDCIATVVIEAPSDLRDVVWAPAHVMWANGGNTVALIPTRYPGSESSEDPFIRLARKTEWAEHEPETYVGSGQRMFATDANDYPLLEVRMIRIGDEPEGEAEADAGAEAEA